MERPFEFTDGEKWVLSKESRPMCQIIGLWAEFLKRHEHYLVFREAFEQERKQRSPFNVFTFLRGRFRGKTIDHNKIADMYIGYTEKLPILPVAILDKHEGLIRAGAQGVAQITEKYNFLAIYDVAKSVDYRLDTTLTCKPYSSIYIDNDLSPDFLKEILSYYDTVTMSLEKDKKYSIALEVLSAVEKGFFPIDPEKKEHINDFNVR